jgi:hypothetical protein
MRRKQLLAALVGGLLVCALGAAAPSAWASAPRSYVLKHPKRERCKARYAKKAANVTERVHGQTWKVRETVCVYVAPKPIVIVPPPPTPIDPSSPAIPLPPTPPFVPPTPPAAPPEEPKKPPATIACLEPPAESGGAPPGEEEKERVVIGVSGGSEMGEAVGDKLKALGFSSERIEAGGPGSTMEQSCRGGWRDDAVAVGNTKDSHQLSSINTASWVSSTLAQVREALSFGYTLLEVGNEMEVKGTHQGPKGEWVAGQAEPAKYAEMFIALSNAVEAAGLKPRLLFSGGGDYQRPNGSWSQIAHSGGWLADALKAQPGLLSAVGGFAEHPYGRAHEDNGEHHGPGGLEDLHANELALGFKNTDVYITEYGVRYTPGEEGPFGASTLALQAQRIKEVFQEFLALPYVRGIWYYQVHDDNTGSWGLVSGSYEPRPSLSTVASFLH